MIEKTITSNKYNLSLIRELSINIIIDRYNHRNEMDLQIFEYTSKFLQKKMSLDYTDYFSNLVGGKSLR